MTARVLRIAAAASASLVALSVMVHGEVANAVELTWTAPAACPMEELSFRVERALGRPLVAVAGPAFEVSVEPQPGGFEGHVKITTSNDSRRPGLRTVEATSCEELIDTLALTLVLAIRSEEARVESSAEAPRPQLAPVVSATEDVMEPVTPPSGPLQREGSGASPTVSALVAVVGDTGSLPAVGLGPALGIDVAWTGLELRALGLLLPSTQGSIDADDPTSPGADIQLVTGAALVCIPLATNATALVIAACAGGEVGRLSGRGTRVDRPYSSAAWWWAARADVAARWTLPVEALAIELVLTAAAPLSREEFVLRDIGSVHQPANVIARASLGLRVELGP